MPLSAFVQAQLAAHSATLAAAHDEFNFCVSWSDSEPDDLSVSLAVRKVPLPCNSISATITKQVALVLTASATYFGLS